MRIRDFFRRAETFRRHFVSVEDVSPDPVRGADNRHGILGLVGRGRSDPADGVKTTYSDETPAVVEALVGVGGRAP